MSARATIADICDAALDLNKEGLALLADPPLNNEGVHRLRVLAKRLRAAWRWCAWELDDAKAKRRQARLGDLGRLFGAERDATILAQLHEDFWAQEKGEEAETENADEESELKDSEPADRPHATVTPREALEQATTILNEDARAWTQLRQIHGNKSIGEQALLKAYKRAMREGRRAMTSDDATSWHDWRKNVKTLLYQMELLFGKKPSRGKTWIKGVRKLAETLGTYHDLAIYSEVVRNSKRTGRQTVQRRAAEIGRKAGHLYNKLFDKRPKRAMRKFRSR